MKLSVFAGLSLGVLMVFQGNAQSLVPTPPPCSPPTPVQTGASSESMTKVDVAEELAIRSADADLAMWQEARLATGRRASADDFTGNWIQLNTSVFDGSVNSPSITITKSGDNYTVANLYLQGSTVNATYNSTSGTLEIAPQVIYTHATYGECALHSYTVQNGKVYMNATAPITMSITSDGTLQMTPWGLFVESGAYKGSAFDAFATSRAGHPNGTFISTPFSADSEGINAPVWISQTSDGTLTVANMLGNSRPLDITLGVGETAYMASQWVMNASLYGDFYLFAANASTGKIDKNNYITVTSTETGFNVGPWGVFCLASTTIYAAWGKESQLVTDFKPVYPQPGENAMAGSGTQTDPWQVKTIDDLRYIALSTTATNSYKGNWFKLMADIDFSTFNQHWFPIGTTDKTPFEGTFLGNGYKIKSLTQDFSGALGAGLFGYTGTSSLLSGITLESINYKGCGRYMGGLVAYAKGKVQDCYVAGTIEAINNEIGGIAGYATAAISGCSFTGALYGGIDMGGIVAYTTSTIENCTVNANILLSTHVPFATTVTHAMGGIAGASYGTNTKITGCSASGIVADLQATHHTGGICGYAYATTISQCLSNVQVVSYATSAVDGASPAAGGIVGYLSKGIIEDCMVAGAVNAAGTEFAGGLCGYGGGANTYEGVFRRCLVTGMVNTASETNTAAVTGSFFSKAPLTISNCYYDFQTSGIDTAANGYASTSSLTSGNLPEGFSADAWSAEKGFYPKLKHHSTTDASMLASCAFTLSGEESIRKVTKSFTAASQGNVKWGIMDAEGHVSTSSAGLSINGDSVKLSNTYASETLIAYLPDGSYRSFTIKVTPKVFEGEGTSENPFLIKNVGDLLTLQQAVNVAGQSHKGDYFRLTSDLDLGGVNEFVGIAATGSASLKFEADFDGAGHKISNFKVEAITLGTDGKPATTRPYAGFFGICSKYSTVRNLVIDKSCSFTFYRYSAPVVAYTQGRVENCINYAPVKSWGVYNGGIVGLAASELAHVKGCANMGTITGVDGFTGGIAGVNYGSIEECFNAASVKIEEDANISNVAACAYAGGIAGANYGIIDACENNAPIYGVKSVGGITGGNSSQSGIGSVTGCLNTAMIYGDKEQGNIAAIIGELASSTTIEGNYYDFQLMPSGATNKGDGNGCTPLRTLEFSNMALFGEGWKATEGYPVPMALASNEDVAKAASVMAVCGDLDVINALESGVTLRGTDVSWSVEGNKALSVSGDKVVFDLDTLKEATGTLIAATPLGDRRYELRAIPALFAGAGTEADPHIIATAADMMKLSDAVNNQHRSYANHNFAVMANLDFDGVEYVPAGNLESPFQGMILGKGHKVSNLKINGTDYVGLLGYGGSKAKISALAIDSTCSISGATFVGAFAGRFDGQMGQLRNEASVTSTGNYCGGLAGYIAEGGEEYECVNAGTVTGGSYTGGLAGVLYGNATDCSNIAPVNGNSTYAGGLAGSLRAILTRCSNSGAVTSVKAQNYVGGISASAEAGTSLIDCENRGDVKGGKNYVGGLFGGCPTAVGTMRENGAFITRSHNYGNIEGSGTNVAGLAGLIASGHHFYGCENHGAVTATGGNTTGGIAGETRGDASYSTTIDSCFNFGAVASTAAGKKDVGGIVGKLASYSTITRCANYGEVTGKGYMNGGIVGDLLGSITDSYNLGSVTGATYANGGIAGYGGSGTRIERCMNGGNVKATDNYTGTYGTAAGIEGYGYSVISDCVNYGDVYGSKTVGGIAGSKFTGLDIVRCYNAGKVSVPEGVTSCGNIFGSATAFTGPVWYDKEINGTLGADHSSYIALSANELMKLDISRDWITGEAFYPIPTTLADNVYARFIAARYESADAVKDNVVTSDFKVAQYPGLEWVSSNPKLIEINGGDAKVAEAANAPVTLTLYCNGLQRNYNFIVNRRGSGVENPGATIIVARDYYDMQGLKVENPAPGTICIERTIFGDGSFSTRRIIVK